MTLPGRWRSTRRPRAFDTRDGTGIGFAAPILTFLGGRLGESKQHHAGALGLVLFLVLVVAFIVWLMTL